MINNKINDNKIDDVNIFNRKCNKEIPISKNKRYVGICTLPKNHDGNCDSAFRNLQLYQDNINLCPEGAD